MKTPRETVRVAPGVRVFRKYRKGPRGARVPYALWYVEFRDHLETVRRLPAFTDQTASVELARKLSRLAALRAAGEGPDRELGRFLEGLRAKMRETLARWGLIDGRTFAGSLPLAQLLTRFEESLRAAGRTEKHVQHVKGRADRAFSACGFGAWSELDAHRLAKHLHGERERGLSARSSNHVLAACKEFSRWAVQQGLAATDPLVTLRPVNAKTDPRRERRALSFDDELPRLIRAAAEGPEHRGVPGPLRALAYRLAAETGLRVGELVALRAGDFDLAGERPTVTVRAATTKNRRERTLPLLRETAQELAGFLHGRMPQAPALALPRSFKDKATRWLTFDLKAAEIPYTDASKRVADFHALRASFVSGLIRHGADARTVQSLARHSSAELTVGLYSKLGRDDERDALARLPELPSPSRANEAARATGTEGAPERGPRCGPFDAASSCTSVHSGAAQERNDDPEKAVAGAGSGGGGGSRTRVPEPGRARRLRV